MRQHLTVEEARELNNQCIAKILGYESVGGQFGQLYCRRKNGFKMIYRSQVRRLITIGVLQAILLEAGYDVEIRPHDTHYTVCVFASYYNTDEPIKIFFQAVKELVLKGVE